MSLHERAFLDTSVAEKISREMSAVDSPFLRLPLALQAYIVSYLSTHGQVRAFMLVCRRARSILSAGIEILLEDDEMLGEGGTLNISRSLLDFWAGAARLRVLDLQSWRLAPNVNRETFCCLASRPLEKILFPAEPGLPCLFMQEYRRHRFMSQRHKLFEFKVWHGALIYDGKRLKYGLDAELLYENLSSVQACLAEAIYALEILPLEKILIGVTVPEEFLSKLLHDGRPVSLELVPVKDMCQHLIARLDQLTGETEKILNLQEICGVVPRGLNLTWLAPYRQTIKQFIACFLDAEDFLQVLPLLPQVPVWHLYYRDMLTFDSLEKGLKDTDLQCQYIVVSPSQKNEPLEGTRWRYAVSRLWPALWDVLLFPKDDKFMPVRDSEEFLRLLTTEDCLSYPFDRPRKRR